MPLIQPFEYPGGKMVQETEHILTDDDASWDILVPRCDSNPTNCPFLSWIPMCSFSYCLWLHCCGIGRKSRWIHSPLMCCDRGKASEHINRRSRSLCQTHGCTVWTECTLHRAEMYCTLPGHWHSAHKVFVSIVPLKKKKAVNISMIHAYVSLQAHLFSYVQKIWTYKIGIYINLLDLVH